jgi:uncharacterized protein (DUF433 family)
MGSQAKSTPVSIRLRPSVELLVRDEAQRSGRSRSSLIEELTEEAAKMRLFPGIAFRDSPRRAWVIGTGLDVWEVIQMLTSYGGDRTAILDAHPSLSEGALTLATTYTERFPEEIAQRCAAQDISSDQLRELYPFLRFGD